MTRNRISMAMAFLAVAVAIPAGAQNVACSLMSAEEASKIAGKRIQAATSGTFGLAPVCAYDAVFSIALGMRKQGNERITPSSCASCEVVKGVGDEAFYDSRIHRLAFQWKHTLVWVEVPRGSSDELKQATAIATLIKDRVPANYVGGSGRPQSKAPLVINTTGLGPGRPGGEEELGRFITHELGLLGRGQLYGVGDSLRTFRDLVANGIGGRWQRDPSPGQPALAGRTALIMECRKYLRGAEGVVGGLPGLRPEYDAAKAALDKASPYRDSYLM